MNTVFVDVDTQLDFVSPAGALYVPGAERVLPLITRLNQYAASHGVPVLSTTDAHAEDDPEFREWPPHCVAGTVGQHKPASTLLDGRVVVPNGDTAVTLQGAQQVILEKQTVDAFETRSLRRVLEALAAGRYVVYGVVTEICVLCAARGLLTGGHQVVVVRDAVRELSGESAARAMEEIRALGGTVSSVSEVCAGQAYSG